MNTVVLVTCIRNFHKNRGPVSGILKGYVGLSTAIFTDLCTTLSSSNPSTFLLMLTIVPFLIFLIAILFLCEIPPSSTAGQDKEEAWYFGIINAVAVVVVVAVVVYLLLFDVTGAHNRLISQSFAIILLILLASPISIPLYIATHNWIRYNSESNSDLEGVVTEPLLGMLEKEKTATEAVVVVERRAQVIGEDHTIIEALRTVDFWVLFVPFLCGVISRPTSRAYNPHRQKRVLLPFFGNVNLTHPFP
ncbi:hypothetical protein TEA_005744 [Camellia sinensis var. sinensis]|uniref:Nodulin-like domain-containing protein n=2 Tax=Camellia sinensis TaxID=4442 RepID=A0A4S4EPS4_CAMSN|nr:hypothetical protein TEA_005744 [Camellia sinensis var. sinensis]